MTLQILRSNFQRFVRLQHNRSIAVLHYTSVRLSERNFCSGMARNLAKKAVVFDLGGVVFEPPQNALRQYGEKLGLPGLFLEKVLIKGRPDNAFCRMERGEITAVQFADEFMADCRKVAEEEGETLPSGLEGKGMFDAFMDTKMVPEILNAIAVLKENGVLTAAVTNNYIDDRENNVKGAGVMTTLTSFYFDHVIESCRVGSRKPDEGIFTEALKRLGVQPNETVFLDDLGPNVKAARELGISTILVKDKTAALKELQDITGIDVFQQAKPVAVHPDKVPHSYVTTRSGHRFHYVEMGSGHPVIFCHGFPESWYEWKRQLPAVAAAGFRAIAMDMKGYGESANPPEISEYSAEILCRDMAEFMDALAIPQATFIGHDWGGMFVWWFATHYADRVSSVAGICTPFLPSVKDSPNPWKKILADPGLYDYQIYFNDVGKAEAELEANPEKFTKVFIRRPQEYKAIGFSTADITKRGGFLVGIPDDLASSDLLTEEELQYYVKQYKTSGLRSMLNWYRNVETNWKWNQRAAGRKLYMPALMVTCAMDAVLPPSMSRYMDPFVLNLSRAEIKDSGHWTPNEQPRQLNKILIDWLIKVHPQPDQPILASLL